MQFTLCGKYVVVWVEGTDSDDDTEDDCNNTPLNQYDVATMSCVRVIPQCSGAFAISPCSRVVVVVQPDGVIVTKHLYPHNSE